VEKSEIISEQAKMRESCTRCMRLGMSDD